MWRKLREISLHRLVTADHRLRSEAPVVAQRVLLPDLRALRPILMPGTRVEIAQRLVLHLIHLGEELDPHLVGVAVIDRDVVADDMAAGTPHQSDTVLGQPLAGYLDLRSILALEGDVTDLQ